jgi:D-tyrosyl-tRNA(Tyr) deacylase
VGNGETGIQEVKVLLQRVSRAAVRVDGSVVGEIGQGLLIFLGVEQGDGEADADYLADKSAELRIFRDDEGKMNRSVEEAGGGVLVVSQFTLAAATRRGRRPSYSRAAAPESAIPLYERFAERLRRRGIEVAEGVFQAMMDVELVNDGPVTILLDPPPFRSGS